MITVIVGLCSTFLPVEILARFDLIFSIQSVL